MQLDRIEIMPQLREDATYRTRDGSRTGIRVKRKWYGSHPWMIADNLAGIYYQQDGRTTSGGMDSPEDLIEETPAPAPEPRPFSYDACPMHEDGRRRLTAPLPTTEERA